MDHAVVPQEVAEGGALRRVEVATGETFGGNLLFIIHHPPEGSALRNFLRDYRMVHAPDATPIPFAYNGAPVGWLSQYPEEAEILWPSGTLLFPVPKVRCRFRAPAAVRGSQGASLETPNSVC